MFEFLVLDDSSTLFSTFNSNAALVERIPGKGIAVSRIVSRNAAYNSQRQKIDLLSEDLQTRTPLWDSYAAAQAPVVSATADGKLFAVSGPWGSQGYLRILRWDNVLVSQTPTVDTGLIPAGAAFGKMTAVWNEAAQRLLVAANNKGFFRFDVNGAYVSGLWAWGAGTHPVEYPYLMPPHVDGTVDLAWTTAQANPFSYLTISYAHSADLGASWAPRAATPYTAAPMAPMQELYINRADEVQPNTWLMAALADGDYLYFAYAINTDLGEQPFLYPQNTTIEYVRVQRSTGVVLNRSRFKCIVGTYGGFFARRTSGLYFVTSHTDRYESEIVVFRSLDDGATWSKFAASPVPIAPPNVLYQLGGDAGKPDDPDLIGIVTVIKASSADAAVWTQNVFVPASTVFFRVNL